MDYQEEAPRITFDFVAFQWKGMYAEDIERWEKLFPDVDVAHEVLKEMPIWLEKMRNTKLAHKKNWNRTILNWLKKEQIKAVL